MKKVICTFVVLCIYLNLSSQSYFLSLPVYDTIRTGTINFYINNCPIGETSISSNLITNMPAGVNLYFKITSSPLPIGCLSITGIGIMNVGDSSLITTINKKFEWTALCGNGNATYAIIAIGTPTVLNDSLFCKSQWYGSVSISADLCSSYFSTDYYEIGTLPQCIVSNFVTTVGEYSKENFSIYPNPTNTTLSISDGNNQFQNTTIQITNYLGKVVFTSPFTKQVDLSNLSAGMYFLTIQDKEKRKTHKFIKEQ